MDGSWMRSVLNTSWTPCRVLRGLNNILCYLAKGKTQSHKTKERGSGYGLWFLGSIVYRIREYLGHLSDHPSPPAPTFQSSVPPTATPPCLHTLGTNTEEGHDVTGQLWLHGMSPYINLKSVPKMFPQIPYHSAFGPMELDAFQKL